MVSVIIPAYNRAACLQRAIKSVLEQTYLDVEVILIDDGSTDDTAEVAGKFQEKYGQRLKYFYQENQGVAAARNTGLKYAGGAYVSFLDSDDFIYQTKIERQMKAMQENRADVCFCNYWFAESGKRRLALRGTVKEPLLDYLQNKMTPQTNAWLFKREVLKDPDLLFRKGCAWGEDMEFFVKALHKADKVVFWDEPLFEYHKNEQSLSAFSWDKLAQDVFIWEEIWQWLCLNITEEKALKAYEAAIFGYRIPALLIYRLWEGRASATEAKRFAEMYEPYLRRRDWSNGLRSMKLFLVWHLFRLSLMRAGKTEQ